MHLEIPKDSANSNPKPGCYGTEIIGNDGSGNRSDSNYRLAFGSEVIQVTSGKGSVKTSLFPRRAASTT